MVWAGNASAVDGFYLFVDPPKDWSDVYIYGWHDEATVELAEPFGTWPGQLMTSDSLWYQTYLQPNQLDAVGGLNLIFHNGRGVQSADLYRTTTGWFVFADDGTGQWYESNPRDPVYTLTVSAGRGSGRYRSGSLVTIEAVSRDEWSRFTGWEGSGRSYVNDPDAAKTQLVMPEQDIELTATFRSLAAGAAAYQQQCQSCHGERGQGGVGPSLLLADNQCASCSSLATLTRVIAETMPFGSTDRCQGEQAGDCAFEVASYVASILNEGRGEDCELNAKTALPQRLRLLTKAEYWATVQQLVGFQGEFPASVFWPEPALVNGFDNHAGSGMVTDRHIQTFLQLSETIVGLANWETLPSAACDGDVSCFVKTFGRRSFRRPLTLAEVADYGALAQGLSPMAAKRRIARSMLLSPHFLYRRELGQFDQSSGLYRLSDYELAALMSYYTVGSMPDETLFAKAAAGALQDPAERQRQVRRLLQTDGAERNIARFAEAWLDIAKLRSASRNDPRLTPLLRQQMIEETQIFVANAFRDDSHSLGQLFTAPYTITRPELAAYYGLPDQTSPGLSRRSYGAQRRGLLAHGSVLASQASHNESSPIKRGVFVRRRLLCQDLPPPPANVDTTIPPPVPGQTIKERLKRHLSQGEQDNGSNSCKSCHQFIDTIGFGLESFDAVGLYRTVYEEIGGVPVDDQGAVKNLEGLNQPSRHEFRGVAELGDILARSESAGNCLVRQLYRFTYGIDEQKSDRCALDKLTKEFAAGDYNLQDLWIAYSGSQAFVYRSADRTTRRIEEAQP
jgi:mono/diheme cytochrome c family protein